VRYNTIIEKLLNLNSWKLLLLSVILAEFFTLIMNTINSYLWWDRLDIDLLLIGTVDAFIVSILVAGLVVYLFSIIRVIKIDMDRKEVVLRKAQSIGRIGSWEWNMLSNELTWSDEVYNLYGVPPGTVPKYETVIEMLLPEYREAFSNAIDDAINKRKAFEGEYRIRSLDRKKKAFYTTGEVIYDETGKPIRMIGVIQDITNRKTLEDSLHKSIKLLENEKQKSELIIQTMGEGLAILSRDYIVTYQNKRHIEMMGESTGKVCHVAYHNSDRICEGCPVQMAMEDGGIHIVERVVGADENKKHVEVTSTLLRDAEGNAIGAIEVTHDITDRKNTEEKLKEYTNTQETLLNEVNHRVKNNLMTLISILTMESRKTRSEETKSVITDLKARISGLSTVHSLLSSKGWKPIKLYHLATEVIRSSLGNSLYNDKSSFNCPPSEVEVTSSLAHQLTLVLNELITNSIKHHSGNGKLMDSFAIKETEQDIVIRYSDSGSGYPKDILDENFSSDNLGLFLVKGIIEDTLRGSVNFHNDSGAVAEITFRKEI
jgi:two-component sensor histidine kinase